MKALKRLLERGGLRLEILSLILSGIALITSLCGLDQPVDPAWVAVILCGIPILLNAAVGLITAFDIKADVLVSLALIASVIIGEIFAAGEIAFIMQLGSLLEDLTVKKARDGIERLVRLTPRTARRILHAQEQLIPADQVCSGDRIRVLPGESIPVDGVILTGHTCVDQSVMTGESMPVDKGPGDEVSGGTLNQFGAIEIRATRVGADSAIQRMIRLVQSADAGKARIVGIADRWATWIVILALTAAALTWILTGLPLRAVTVLVVFCPCALVLATPTAIMAAIGNATRHGFLIREGDALERLAGVTRIAFDKTGTLTYGRPCVTALHSTLPGLAEAELYRIAAAAEGQSEHPLGRAIARCYRTDIGGPVPPVSEFRMIPGRGVSAAVEGHPVLAGNAALLSDHGIPLPPGLHALAQAEQGQGCTVVFLAVDHCPAGILALSDTLREDAAGTVAQLRGAGITPVLLTGDHSRAAEAVAAQVNIQAVQSGCLPEDKLSWITSSQRQGQPVCMIGDGINDAPALKTAQVGIAMGGIGSDIAVNAADIALVSDQIHELPHLFRLSRRMMTTIQINLAFSMILNAVAIILAVTGVFDPVVGALVHNVGSILVILHSALLLRWKRGPTAGLQA